MSTKNYNKPLTDVEMKEVFKTGRILGVSAMIFMGVMAALVHIEAIRLYPSNMNAEMVKGYAQRVEFAARYQTLLVSWLMFNVIATIYVRLTTKSINPLDEKSEQNVHMINRILNNSYEQIVLSVFAQLIFVSFATPECILRTIPLVNIIQFVGRIAFFYGYPLRRAFGFFCSQIPTVLLIAYNIYSFMLFLLAK